MARVPTGALALVVLLVVAETAGGEEMAEAPDPAAGAVSGLLVAMVPAAVCTSPGETSPCPRSPSAPIPHQVDRVDLEARVVEVVLVLQEDPVGLVAGADGAMPRPGSSAGELEETGVMAAQEVAVGMVVSEAPETMAAPGVRPMAAPCISLAALPI